MKLARGNLLDLYFLEVNLNMALNNRAKFQSLQLSLYIIVQKDLNFVYAVIGEFSIVSGPEVVGVNHA